MTEKLQNISLADQRSNRQTQVVRGHGRLDGYSPDQFGRLTDEEKLNFIKQIDGEYQRFAEDYPQITGLFERDADERSLEGTVNIRRLSEWLQARHVAASYINLQAAFNDIYDQLFLDPSKCGVQGSPALGRDVIRDMPAADFKRLLQPVKAAEKPWEHMTADEWKRQHPEGWADERSAVQAEDVQYVQKQIRSFLSLRPAYARTQENLDAIQNAMQERGLRFNVSTLLGVFDELVASGKIKPNQDAVVKVGSTTRTDFAESPATVGLIRLL